VLAGRYRVDELVARGGMSEVYRGHDIRLDRRVAVKVLAGRLAADGAAVRRMEREARAVASLQHPNVVGVYDHGEEADGTPFLVMEWIDGRSLKDVVAGGPLPEDEARRITLQLLAALDHAHEHGIVHRDIKPQNVLITPEGTAKLTDFGIARSLDATAGLTMAGQIIGTAAYLSPEQARGEPVTPASDVYSVGAVLFELVTGRPPFAADSAMATALRHVEDPVPDVRTLRRDASPEIAAIVATAMAKRPADRYPSAAAMAAALTEDAGPTLVMPARPPAQRGKRNLMLALLLVALALLAGLGAWALGEWGGSDGRAAASSPTTTAKPKLTSIPSVVGLQYVTAARRLKAAGLTPVRDIGGYDTNAKDSVISVSRSGRVPEGSTILLTVSSGPAPAPPPEDKGHHKKHHKHRGHGNGDG
jgi:serine/threonine-protein kinase